MNAAVFSPSLGCVRSLNKISPVNGGNFANSGGSKPKYPNDLVR